MLDWFKRVAHPVTRENSVDTADVMAPPVEAATAAAAAAAAAAISAVPAALSTEQKVERLVDRFGSNGKVPATRSADATAADAAVVSAATGNIGGGGPSVVGASGGRVSSGGGGSNSPGARVIVVASQKGGSGKTTLAAHLGVRAGTSGAGPVILVDTDPQGSLREWWRARNEADADAAATPTVPALETLKPGDVAVQLADMRRRSGPDAIVIIDTPPALTQAIEQFIALADLVLVPARPSPHDLRAIGATIQMARRAGKPFLFVVNGAAPRANITAEAVAALSEHGQVAPVILYQRTDYAASMIDGRTVMEAAPTSRSAQEIAELWKYVHGRLSLRAAA